MNEDGGQKIFNFLMEMIRLKELQQNNLLPAAREIQTNESYIRDYCTIQLNAGRQVGHTTAITNLIEHYSLQKKKVLVIAPALNKIQQLQRKMKIIGSEMEKYVSFESCSDTTRLIGYRADLVIFDMFHISNFANDYKNFIKQMEFVSTLNSKNFMVVLLG